MDYRRYKDYDRGHRHHNRSHHHDYRVERSRSRSRDRGRNRSRDKYRDKYRDKKHQRDSRSSLSPSRSHSISRSSSMRSNSGSSSRQKHRHYDKPDNYHHTSKRRKYSDDKQEKRSKESDKDKGKDSIPDWDDSERHLKLVLGESITPRYKILSVMGEGTFGKVAECWDRELKRYVAVKIVRAIEKYTDAAMIEMDILEAIRKNDPKNQQPCIQMLSWFTYRDHVCMVFDKLGLSLFDFMKKNKFTPFLLKDIQQFGINILKGVAFLHSIGIVHTDLKPENILLCNSNYTVKSIPGELNEYRIPKSTDIKLIDFGSATFDSHHHTSVISTRHYRAPEVIFGVGWTYPCDIFSVGCILAELFVGDAIFHTHENHEHLALFQKTLGELPKSIVQSADKGSRKYFKEDDTLIWPGTHSASSDKHVQKQQSLKEMIVLDPNNEAQKVFYELLQALLCYNPAERPTAEDALRHKFFKMDIVEEEVQLESPRSSTESNIQEPKAADHM